MLSVLITTIRGYFGGERGQDLIEYAMLGGLIALALTGVAVAAFSGALDSMITGIGSCIDFTPGGCEPF